MKISCIGLVCMSLLFTAGGAAASTVSFANVDQAMVSFTQNTTIDVWQATLTGLSDRIGSSGAEYTAEITIDPGGTVPAVTDSWDRAELNFFDVPTTQSQSGALGALTEAGGIFTTTITGTVAAPQLAGGNYTAWLQVLFLDDRRAGINPDAIITMNLAFTNLLPVGGNPNGDPPPIPLPAAGWLLLAGIGGLAAVARRRRSALVTA